MITENQNRIFISYSRADKEFALKLTQALKAASFHVWLDQFDIPTGARWDNELEKALSECGVFLVILTPDSIASENVKDEIGYAIDSQKRILPVLLENCVVPLRLRRFQYVDFTAMSYDQGVESAKHLLMGMIDKTIQAMPKEAVLAATQARVEHGPHEVTAATLSPMADGEKASSQKTWIGVAVGIVALIALSIAGIALFSRLSGSGAQPLATSQPSPTVFVPQATATLGAQVLPTQIIPTETALPLENKLVGLWEIRSTNATEHFTFQADGNFTIEAKNNSTGKIFASAQGTYTYDQEYIYYQVPGQAAGSWKPESYRVENGGEVLVITTPNGERVWTRIK